MRDSRPIRNLESSTFAAVDGCARDRYGRLRVGRRRALVPMPVRIASEACRSACACSRARSLVIHPVSPWPVSPRLAAILPSSVIAAFIVTSGRPVRMACTNGSLIRVAASSYSGANTISMPAARRRSNPCPATSGWGPASPLRPAPRPPESEHRRKVRCGRGANMVERDVCRGAARAFARFRQGLDLSVFYAGPCVEPSPNDFAATHQHRARQQDWGWCGLLPVAPARARAPYTRMSRFEN